jgi:flagellar hook-associated protein 1 FlgK
MANIFTIGQSALAAAQAGVSTAGQNIANASTPGYSRQSVIQAATTPQPMGYGYIGQGTQVTEIQRVYNSYLGNQVVAAQTNKSQLDAQYAQIQQIDNMLADPKTGLSPAIQNYFNSLQDLSVFPADAPARQSVLSNAEALVASFQNVQGRMEDIRQGINQQVSASVQTINQTAQQLVAVNQAIERAQSLSNGQPPNALLDQRDKLVQDLSKQIKVTVSQQDNQYSVFIGNGQPLVTGATSHSLVVLPSTTDPTRLEVAYGAPTQKSILSIDNLAGGALGGLLEFRSQTLDPIQNSFGRVALALASNMNSQQAQGFTLNQTAGGNFFNLPTMSAVPSTQNTGSGVITASLTDASKLTTSDYKLQNVAGVYQLIRVTDSKIVASGDMTAVSAAAISTEGFSIAMAGTPSAGDGFLIRPTAGVAGAMTLAISNTNDIAAASQKNAAGDNSNVLKMIALQTSKTLNAGQDSYQSAYAQLVNQVGSKTHELDVTSASAGTIQAQALTALQNVSGVNLDEEGANLIRYQQAYQAAGKVLQIAKQMFDSLLAINP